MAEPSASTSQPPATQSALPSQTQSQEIAPSSTIAEATNSTQDPVPKQEPGTAGGEDIDASVEHDIDMAGTDTNNNTGENGNATANPSAAATAGGLPVDPVAPAPPPTKKETSLREFLGKMDEYAPIVSITFPPSYSVVPQLYLFHRYFTLLRGTYGLII